MAAKKILVINTDKDAPIVAKADYAVIADLHEILPAISAEVRKLKGYERFPYSEVPPKAGTSFSFNIAHQVI